MKIIKIMKSQSHTYKSMSADVSHGKWKTNENKTYFNKLQDTLQKITSDK